MFCYVVNAIGLTWALNPTGIFLQHMHHYKHWQTSPAIDQSLKPTLTNLLFRILCLYIHYRYLMSNLLGNPIIQNSVWFTIGRSIQSEVKLNYNGCVTIIAALKRNWRGVSVTHIFPLSFGWETNCRHVTHAETQADRLRALNRWFPVKHSLFILIVDECQSLFVLIHVQRNVIQNSKFFSVWKRN